MSFNLDEIEQIRKEKFEKIKNKILEENKDKMNLITIKINLVFKLQKFNKKFNKLDDDIKLFIILNLKTWADYNIYDNLKEIVHDINKDFYWTKLCLSISHRSKWLCCNAHPCEALAACEVVKDQESFSTIARKPESSICTHLSQCAINTLHCYCYWGYRRTAAH